MTREEFKELTKKYVELDKYVREYREQFFTSIWSDRVIRKAKKVEAIRAEITELKNQASGVLENTQKEIGKMLKA
ncbi:MAG: hypothetical protein Q8R26_01380 [bacterium]|nr:hypothetical protein [bacterium]